MSDYNLTNIRALLLEGFGAADLKQFCHDTLQFKAVHHQLADLSSKSTVVDHLIEYATQRLIMANLLAWAKIKNPARYQYHQPYHLAPAPTSPQPKINNPFGDLGRIDNPTYFVTQHALEQLIFDELRKGVSLSLVGESGSGKSSFLAYLQRVGLAHLPGRATDIIFESLELVRDEADLFEMLCDPLKLPPLRRIHLARKLRGRRVVACLDEVERLTQLSPTVWSELRGLADGPDAPFTYVFASRSPLTKLLPDDPTRTSPLANLFFQETMPPFTLAEATEMATRRLSPLGLHLPPDLIAHLHRETGGHPRRLQLAFKAAFEGAKWVRN